MELIDFNQCRRIMGRGYRGNAGRKLSYLYNGHPWMVKFPGTTKDLQGKHLPSYTTGPLSEYIGSQVYAALGIDVHETVLGICEGKLVVGCRDFTEQADLLEYSQIKNTIDDSILSGSYGSSAAGERLSDVLKILETSEEFAALRDSAIERFWDMFVVDTFIHNNDRNNGNWGLLVGRYETTLAPVFDNGNAFFNKRNPSLIDRRLADEKLVKEDALGSLSFFLDDEDHRIHPFKYLASTDNMQCIAAMKRFEQNLNLSEIDTIIESIPEFWNGIEVISPAQKAFYKAILKETYESGFKPVLAKLNSGGNNG